MLRPVHFEIQADDLPRAVAFYGNLFGWEFREMVPGYHLAKTGPDDQPGIHGAIMQRKGGHVGDAVIAYVCTIDVPSLDDYLERVKTEGGTQVTEAESIPGVGDYAYCKDTEGNIFGMMEEAASTG